MNIVICVRAYRFTFFFSSYLIHQNKNIAGTINLHYSNKDSRVKRGVELGRDTNIEIIIQNKNI